MSKILIPDRAAFERAAEACREAADAPSDIGTYNEKTLHKTLKYYFCPDCLFHEITLRGKICDAYGDGKIYEIQTGNFSHLKDKLKVFLPEYEVIVVYPLVIERTVKWIDPETSEIVSERRSGKRGIISDILPELYAIREFLNDEKLSIMIAGVECAELRLLNGYGKDRKIRAKKYDIIPTRLISLQLFSGMDEYGEISPSLEDREYKADEIYKLLKMRKGADAWRALRVLVFTGKLAETGKSGRATVYRPLR